MEKDRALIRAEISAFDGVHANLNAIAFLVQDYDKPTLATAWCVRELVQDLAKEVEKIALGDYLHSMEAQEEGGGEESD
jgi:3-methyladenine DNA glycosylase AlkC